MPRMSYSQIRHAVVEMISTLPEKGYSLEPPSFDGLNGLDHHGLHDPIYLNHELRPCHFARFEKQLLDVRLKIQCLRRREGTRIPCPLMQGEGEVARLCASFNR